MKNLSWKIGFALLTFFVGTVLALIWVTLDNKPIAPVIAQSHSSQIEIIAPTNKIPDSPAVGRSFLNHIFRGVSHTFFETL
jgi:Flp pilus assembly protein protease CpaA